MTVFSNSVFFHVLQTPPLDGSGWMVRVLDRTNYTTPVAYIYEYVELSVGPELNASGAGSITLDLDSPFWSTLLPNGQHARTLLDLEYLWEAWQDGVLRFQFLGRNVEEQIIDDSETRVVTVSGPGAAEVLAFAAILRPGFPSTLPLGLDPETSVGSTNASPVMGWEFPIDWPAMRMWWALYIAAQSRGTIPWVQPMFTELKDSGGDPWEYIPTIPTSSGLGFRPQLGESLLDFLNDCTGQDYSRWFAERAEWHMWPGFRLDVRKHIGAHREDQVIFFEGAMQQKQRTRKRDKIANVVSVRDVTGYESNTADATSIGRWNRRELLEDKNGNIVDEARRNVLSHLVLEQNKDENSQWVIQVPYDDPNRRPFRDYQIGDWIGIGGFGTDGVSTVDAYRVLAIVINVNADSVVPTVELTLQSKLEAFQRQLEQQITELVNKVIPGETTTIIDQTINNIFNPPGGITPPGISIPPGFGFGSGFGVRVFIQPNDPGDQASPGDFWYDTDATLDTGPTYTPEPSLPLVVADDFGHYVHIVYPPSIDDFGHIQ